MEPLWENSLTDWITAIGSLLAVTGALSAALFALFPEHVRRFFVPIRLDVDWHQRDPYLGVYENASWLRMKITNLCSRDVQRLQVVLQSMETLNESTTNWTPTRWFVPIRLQAAHTNASETDLLISQTSVMWNLAVYSEHRLAFTEDSRINHNLQGERSPNLTFLTEVHHRGSVMPMGVHRFELAIVGLGGVYWKGRVRLTVRNETITYEGGTQGPNVRVEITEIYFDRQSRLWWR